jgi:NO-binding membrane sensor protein with MHYT domain
MHFIGNRAIVLGNGDTQFQISYNVAFTAVSFALPVIVLLGAFYAISFEDKATIPHLLIGGLLAGGAVCGMHYVGQLGIDNYLCHYEIGNVIGAAIIAAVSATLALSVFFRWKAAWNDSWWRRCICGALLACAVTGMHYTAAVGTTYKPKSGDISSSNELSRRTTVIVCAVLVSIF